MNQEQEERAMELLGLTEPPAMERSCTGPDGSGGCSLFDAAGALLGSVLIDADGNVSLP